MEAGRLRETVPMQCTPDVRRRVGLQSEFESDQKERDKNYRVLGML
jgi:hypothetical protein